jgi:hypothetical protein
MIAYLNEHGSHVRICISEIISVSPSTGMVLSNITTWEGRQIDPEAGATTTLMIRSFISLSATAPTGDKPLQASDVIATF